MKRQVARPLKGSRGERGFQSRWWRITCDHPGCSTTTHHRALHDMVETLARAGWSVSKRKGQDWCPDHKPAPPRPKAPKPITLLQRELFDE